MKVFLAGTSFQPSYGGPAVSVSRLALALCEAGVEVGLWAPDGSAVDSPVVVKHPSLRLLDGDAVTALDHFGKPDIIHDSGIWLGHNRQLAKLAAARGIPRVVSTRGMLEPWALNHKKWKKRLAWWFYQRRDLRAAAAVHATADSEEESLRKLGLNQHVVVIPNGVDLPVKLKPEKLKAESGERNALFLSRIHRKKGLPLLLEAWAKVRAMGWRLHIVGPDEEGHRAELERQATTLGLTNQVWFSGALGGEAKEQVFRDSDLFILPTHSENFGIAVAEAMARRLPVITTHGAPWKLLEQERCGWWVPVSVDGIAAALQEACGSDAATLQAMGARGRQVVEERFAWERIATEMVACYEWVLGRGGKPECVRD